MRIVIKISEKRYKEIVESHEPVMVCRSDVAKTLKNGTLLPKGHGRLIDADKFLKMVKKDRDHEIHLHSWTADMVLKRLDSWYAPTIIEADKAENKDEVKE